MWREVVKKRIEKLKDKQKIKMLSEKEFEELQAAKEILCFTGDFYDAVIEYMKKFQINEVVDIGCSYGFQAEAFYQAKLNYIGIEKEERKKHLAGDVKYIYGIYPFALGQYPLAVACNCFHHGFFPYKALAMDFETVIVDKLINRSEAEKYFTINTSKVNPFLTLYILHRK